MGLHIILTIYVLIALTLVVSILLHGAKPSKTLGWLLAIFTVPVGGIFLYLLLGRNRRKNKLILLKKERFFQFPKPSLEHMSAMHGQFKKLMTLVYRNSHFPPTEGNDLQLLKDGKTTFEAIFKALDAAQHTIHLQYYIFEEGELADAFLILFAKKIKEGVSIRMIYDGVGSFSLSKKYINKLEAIGVEVYPFLPFKFGRFFRSLNYRNHRKIIVIDGYTGFTGGINISDKYLKGDEALGKWHDMHLQIIGPAATHLDYVFTLDWYLVSQQECTPAKRNSDVKVGTNSLVQIVAGGPDDDFASLEQTYFSMINKAEKYIYITNPYIIPGQALLQALQTAALSGVDVRLLVSEKADSKIVGWSVRSYFEALLKSGIKIHLFPDGFLHSKIIVSDDVISTIGTANLDDRSFEQNYEVNAVMYDSAFAKLLKADFLKDAHRSKSLTYVEFVNRPWSDKLKEGFGKLFSALL